MAGRPPLVQAFRDFAFRITPERAELEVIQTRAESIRESVGKLASDAHRLFPILQKHCPGHLGTPLLKYVRTSAFGSAQRGTLIRPVEKIDVDLLLLFEGLPTVMNQFDDGQNFLRAILELLRELPAKATLFEGECIRLEFGQPPLIDVFAAIDWFGRRSVFSFPHGRPKTWYRSNPVVLDQLVLKRNAELEGRFTWMLRMLKSWNRHCAVGLRSFHHESLAIREVKELHGYWPVEISSFLEAGARRRTEFLSIRSHDGATDDLSWDMSTTEKDDIIQNFQRAARIMQQGIDAAKNRNLDSALSSFRTVLGDAFPLRSSPGAHND
jgi:hypothetical protein